MRDINMISENGLFQAYIMDYFTYAFRKSGGGSLEVSSENGINTSSESGTSTSTEQGGERNLKYEVEYILSGKESDAKNLESVLTRILFIRLGINFLYLQTAGDKKAQVSQMALTLTSAIGLPVLAPIVEQALLFAWAFGESIMDLRTLTAGKRVPVLKNSSNWQLSLTSLANLGTPDDVGEGEGVEDGLSYGDYLRLLLLAQGMDVQTLRTLDRIEENLRHERGLTYFRVDNCLSKVRLMNTATIRGDITYEFPLYFGYN